MSTTELVAVRLEPELIRRIDALKSFFSSSWLQASRSDVLRNLIVDGLARLERAQRAERSSKAKPPAAPSKRPPKKR